jgi:hypothetical protein
MNPFDEYLKKKGVEAGSTATAVKPTPIAASPFDAYLQKKKAGVPATPFDALIQQKDATNTQLTKHPLRWVGAQLMKPIVATSAIEEGIGKAAATGSFKPLAEVPKNVWGAVTGENTRTFVDQVKEAFPESSTAGTLAGLGLDIFLDPTTYLTGGLTKIGRVAAAIDKLKKAGRVVEAGSKIAKDIAATGKTAEELVLAGTKAEQAAKGQRAFLQIAGQPILPAKVSESIYKATAGASKVIQEAPFIGGVIERGRQIFNTTTGNPAVDKLLTIAKNSGDYAAAKYLEKAVEIQRLLLKNVQPEDYIKVSDYVEKNIVSSNKTINEIGEALKPIYKEMVKTANKYGVKTGEHEFYMPHIPIPEKGKISEWLSPKKWSTSLKYAQARDIMKFKSEAGKTLIGTAKDLKLKPVNDVKGLTHDLTWGQFKTIKDVEHTLREYGYKLVFKPQAILRGNALGYYNPKNRSIVIATVRPTLKDVMTTLKHEITHNAHFQIAGNISMYELMAKTGRSADMLKALNNANDAVRKEWKQILEFTEGMSEAAFKRLPHDKREYYSKPTELLARVGAFMMEHPDIGRKAFPESAAALDDLRKSGRLFDILNVVPPERGAIVSGQVFRDKSGELFQAIEHGIEKVGISEVKAAFKKPMFEENPAVQLAIRGKQNAKSVASARLFEAVKDFALPFGEEGVKVKVPELEGLFFEPGVAKQLDAYYKATQPEELGKLMKAFDDVQNWWKGQALISPGYHLRNAAGNVWNNFLAGVKNPKAYTDAALVQAIDSPKIFAKLPKALQDQVLKFSFVDAAGKTWNGKEVLEWAKKTGVVGSGWYSGDIPVKLANEVKGGTWNLASSEGKLFRANKAVGSEIENNARLANFIHQLKKGIPVQEAAMETKKYLFDYTDLTSIEQTILKRVMPFYTFTRKNIPLQFENLIKQPGKYTGLEKVVQTIEDVSMGDTSPANEKYLSDYIKNSTSMRVGYNPDDKTYSYFLLGAWLPSYQAMDFFGSTLPNMVSMISPLIKTIPELAFNTSSFWKNTLGSYEEIENYPGDQVNFLGMNMPKKTAQVLRNIRLLNDLDKLNPGLIFGGKKGQKSIWARTGLPAVSVPGIGNISPSQFKYTMQGSIPAGGRRTSNLFFSKTADYKPVTAREYYNQDTQDQVTAMKRAISRAAATGDRERVKLIIQQLRDFLKKRGS